METFFNCSKDSDVYVHGQLDDVAPLYGKKQLLHNGNVVEHKMLHLTCFKDKLPCTYDMLETQRLNVQCNEHDFHEKINCLTVKARKKSKRPISF